MYYISNIIKETVMINCISLQVQYTHIHTHNPLQIVTGYDVIHDFLLKK